MSDPIEWPTHEDNCDCDECLRSEIDRLTRERDDARTEAELMKQAGRVLEQQRNDLAQKADALALAGQELHRRLCTIYRAARLL